MSIFFSLAVFMIINFFAGFNIILLFDRKNTLKPGEVLGLSYLFGISAFSLELYFLWIFGIKICMANVLLPWIIPAFLNIRRYKPCMVRIGIKLPKSFSGFEKLIFSLLSLEIIYTFFRAMMKPIESYDSVAIWGLKAKILYLTKPSLASFFEIIKTAFHGAHADYPLLLPFSEVWFYTYFGRFDDYWVKIIFPLNFLMFLVIFYSLVKLVTGKKTVSLFFTFILASIKQFNDYAAVSLADMGMAIFIFLALAYLFMWAKFKYPVYFFVSMISCAFSLLTKNEGALLLFVVLILLAGITVIKKPPKEAAVKPVIFAALIPLGLFLCWLFFKMRFGLENDIINANTFKGLAIQSVFKKIVPIMYEYEKQVFGFKKWNFIWVAFISFAIIRFRKIFSSDLAYLMVSVILMLSAYTAIYLITPHEINWHLSTSGSRLLIHILPLAVFIIALGTSDIFDEARRPNT